MEGIDLELNGIQFLGVEFRRHVDLAVVEEYAEHWRKGIEFPPIIVYLDHKNGKHWLADGYHRFEACKMTGGENIRVRMKEGGRTQAEAFALGANARHGYRRTREQTREAVRTALRHRKRFGLGSVREVAELCNVSVSLVKTIRDEMGIPPPEKVKVRRRGRDGEIQEYEQKAPPGRAPKMEVLAELSEPIEVEKKTMEEDLGSVCHRCLTSLNEAAKRYKGWSAVAVKLRKLKSIIPANFFDLHFQPLLTVLESVRGAMCE